MTAQSSNKALMRKLTVPEALKRDDLCLYVMNIVKPGGNINLTAKGEDGQMQSVVIPKTFIPVDMTLFINRANLLNNQIFRQLVVRGDVVIVHPDDAEKAIEAHPNAKKEQKRILSSNTDYDVAGGAAGNSGYIEMKDTGGSLQQRVESDASNISPFAAGIVSRAASEDVADLMMDIEANRDTLSTDDLEFIATNVEDATLKQFIVDQLA
jgi:hypothetical protein